MGFTNDQQKLFRDRLLKLNPPEEVLEKFDRLVGIAGDFEFEDRLEDILRDAARIANWTRPWSIDNQNLTFRAHRLDPKHPEYHTDCGGENSPAIEQAYRRGVAHGIARARVILGLKHGDEHPVAQEEVNIRRWRFAELHDRNTVTWGSFVETDHPCLIRTTSRRSGLRPKIRWKVLERDCRRCVVCGASANAGVLLEVDHIVPVSKGGTDDIDNLQTLCFDCNRGKGVE